MIVICGLANNRIHRIGNKGACLPVMQALAYKNNM